MVNVEREKQEQMGVHEETELNCTNHHWLGPDVIIFSGEKILMGGLISFIVKL